MLWGSELGLVVLEQESGMLWGSELGLVQLELVLGPLNMCCMSLGSKLFLLDNLHSTLQHLHRSRLPPLWLLGRSHRQRSLQL